MAKFKNKSTVATEVAIQYATSLQALQRMLRPPRGGPPLFSPEAKKVGEGLPPPSAEF